MERVSEGPVRGAFLDPRDEWVLMWRRGLEPKVIARWCGTTPGAVRKHLGLRASLDANLWQRRLMEHHQPGLPVFVPGTRGAEWERWGAMLAVLVEREGRWPRHIKAPRGCLELLEAALHRWLGEQRRRHRGGELGPGQVAALDGIRGGWINGRRPGTQAVSEGNWERNLAGCVAFIAEHGFRPNGSTPATRVEGRLGRWLYYQRSSLAAGTLSPSRIDRLDAVLPEWRSTRPVASRGRRSGNPGPGTAVPGAATAAETVRGTGPGPRAGSG